MEGKGNSLARQEYSFTDYSPYSGNNYYRLRQTDFDGQTSYSPVRNIFVRNENNKVTIFPNPASNELNFKNDSGQEIVGIAVFNQFGQMMNHIENPGNKVDISSFPTGIYFVDIQFEKSKSKARFQVQ